MKSTIFFMLVGCIGFLLLAYYCFYKDHLFIGFIVVALAFECFTNGLKLLNKINKGDKK